MKRLSFPIVIPFGISHSRKAVPMKTSVKKIIALSALSLSALAQPSIAADKGGAGTHGGDMLVSEFTGSARRIALEISKQGNPGSCVPSSQLFEAIDATKVRSALTVFRDGEERDADNDPVKKAIEISRSRLINVHDPLNYLVLVLHEYMGILGLEKTNEFNLSQGCIQQLQLQGTDLASLRHRVNPLAGTIEKFSKGELILRCDLSSVHPHVMKSKQYYPHEFRYQVTVENPTKKDLRQRYFHLHEVQPNGQLLPGQTAMGKGLATLESRLRNWKVHYDIATGKTEVTMVAGGLFKIDLGTDADPLDHHSGWRFRYVSDGTFSVEAIPTASGYQPYVTGTCTTRVVSFYGGQ